ncbi:MAG: hypothetical protein Q7J78_01160, partial [Clostridiales bacterium]|nr:hypothetical protein [Clostridiales bacterium]
NWQQTREHFVKWWNRDETSRPLLIIKPPRTEKGFVTNNWTEPAAGLDDLSLIEQVYLNSDLIFGLAEKNFEESEYMAEAFPYMYAYLGAGSLGTFLGAKPVFRADTIWYEPCFNDIEKAQLFLDKNSRWWNWSIETTKKAVKRAGDNYLIGIPGLVENLDILAALLGTEKLLFYLIDAPDEIHRLQKQLLGAYYEAYEEHYNLIKDKDGWSVGEGNMWGPGKIQQVQCDFSAMISPGMFDEFVLPYLKEECNWLDHSFYHVDGAEEICHLDSILKIESLDCIEFTPPAYAFDGGYPCWDIIYKKALNAGKGIYAIVHPKSFKEFVKRFGSTGVAIYTWPATVKEAEEL